MMLSLLEGPRPVNVPDQKYGLGARVVEISSEKEENGRIVDEIHRFGFEKVASLDGVG